MSSQSAKTYLSQLAIRFSNHPLKKSFIDNNTAVFLLEEFIDDCYKMFIHTGLAQARNSLLVQQMQKSSNPNDDPFFATYLGNPDARYDEDRETFLQYLFTEFNQSWLVGEGGLFPHNFRLKRQEMIDWSRIESASGLQKSIQSILSGNNNNNVQQSNSKQSSQQSKDPESSFTFAEAIGGPGSSNNRTISSSDHNINSSNYSGGVGGRTYGTTPGSSILKTGFQSRNSNQQSQQFSNSVVPSGPSSSNLPPSLPPAPQQSPQTPSPPSVNKSQSMTGQSHHQTSSPRKMNIVVGKTNSVQNSNSPQSGRLSNNNNGNNNLQPGSLFNSPNGNSSAISQGSISPSISASQLSKNGNDNVTVNDNDSQDSFEQFQQVEVQNRPEKALNNAEIQKLNQQIAIKDQEIDGIKKENQSLRANLDTITVKIENYEFDLERLRKHEEKGKEDLQNKSQDLEKLEEELKTVKHDKQVVEDRERQLAEEKRVLQEEKEKINNEIKELKNKNSKEEGEIQKDLEVKVKELKEKQDALEGEKKINEKLKEEQSVEKKKHEEETKQQKNEIEKLQQSNKELLKQKEELEKKNLEQENDSNSTEIDKLKNDYMDQKEKMEKLISELESQLSDKKNEYGVMMTKVIQLGQEKVDQEEKNKELLTQQSKLKEKVQTLESNLKLAEEKVEDSNKHLHRLESLELANTDKDDVHAKTVKVLNEEIEELKQKKNEEMEKNTKSIGKLKTELEKIKGEIAGKDKEIADVNQKIEEKEKEIQDKGQKIEEKEKMISKLNKNNENMKEGMKSLEDKGKKENREQLSMIEKLKSQVQENLNKSTQLESDRKDDKIKFEQEMKNLQTALDTKLQTSLVALESSLKAKSDESTKSYEKKIREMTSQHDQKVKELSTELNSKKSETTAITRKFEQYQLRIRQQLDDFKTHQLTKLKKQILDAKTLLLSSFKDEMITDLRRFLHQFVIPLTQKHVPKIVENSRMLLDSYKFCDKERKRLHNQVMELKGNLRVFARVRPLNEKEKKGQNTTNDNIEAITVNNWTSEIKVTQQTSNSTQSNSNISKSQQNTNDRLFQFDKCFPPTCSQKDVFEEVEPLAISVIDGYNVCIFAYGQTSSGKTHTMRGPGGSSSTSEADRGLYSRVISALFDEARKTETNASNMNQNLQGLSSGYKYRCKFKFTLMVTEIYNESLRDLLGKSPSNLSPSSDSKAQQQNTTIDVKLQQDGSVLLQGVEEVVIQSADEVLSTYLVKADKNRSQGKTDMNEHSSRSHQIVTIKVEKTIDDSVFYGKIHLIDLAGSENVGKSGATGNTLKEAQNINKSLSALGDVIQALQQNKGGHIPYRNSKLTMMLKDSLGGDSKMLMIANCSPASTNVTETLSTLNFASRARQVELGRAKRNVATAAAVKNN